MGDETEAEDFDEESGEDEGETLPEACQQEQRREGEHPT